MVERLGETSEYAQWYWRMKERLDKHNLPYPPELVKFLEEQHQLKLKEARSGRQED